MNSEVVYLEILALEEKRTIRKKQNKTKQKKVLCPGTGADEQEHAIPLHSCHGVFEDRFIFRSNFSGMSLPWECHDPSQATN